MPDHTDEINARIPFITVEITERIPLKIVTTIVRMPFSAPANPAHHGKDGFLTSAPMTFITVEITVLINWNAVFNDDGQDRETGFARLQC